MKRNLHLLIAGIMLLAGRPAGAQLRSQAQGLQKAAIGTLESLSLQAASTGILLLAPREFSHWPEHPWQNWRSNLKRAYTTPPVWDQDHWVVNYVGHPYMGAWFYNSVRSQGCSVWSSAAMSLAQTFVWEYVLEAMHEQPSANDLIVTPLAGIILGEAIHQLTLFWLRDRVSGWEKTGIIILNPLYAMNNGFK